MIRWLFITFNPQIDDHYTYTYTFCQQVCKCDFQAAVPPSFSTCSPSSFLTLTPSLNSTPL